MDIAFIISYTLLGLLILFILVLAFCWKDYCLIYDHRLLFVIGLVFSRSLTNHAVTDVIMWYVTDNEDGGFVRSVVLSNIQDSLSSLFVIFMAHSADSFVGRFRTLVFSTTAYIGGILILWIFNPYDVTCLIVVAIVLLALGKSGENILEYVLTDLVYGIDTSANRNKKRSLVRGAIWWRIPHGFGAIAAILWVAPFASGGVHPTWNTAFLICLISMTAALIIFCTGHNVYHQSELTQRPVQILLRVICAKRKNLFKSKSRCSMNTPVQERSPETMTQGNEGIPRSAHHFDTYGKKPRGNSSYKDDIKVVGSLLRMFPMLVTLLGVSVISAAGSTFYIEQFSNLRGNEKIPAQMFDIIQGFSGFSILALYGCTPFYRNEKLKIGVGMVCSIISCAIAWILEFKRLKEVYKLVDEDENTSISVFWLMPQFSILGCMEGLTHEGLLKFLQSQIDQPFKSYCVEYMEIVISLGKLVNIAFFLIIRWCFGYDVNDIRLDKYYLILVCLCLVNFVFYCCIAKCFYKKRELDPHSDQDNLQLDHENFHDTTWRRVRWNCFLVLLSR